MADKQKVTITYDIVDDKGSKVDETGKPYGVRQYSGVVDENGEPHGGSLFVDAYNAKKNGYSPQIYKSPSDSEDWTPKEDAKINIGVATNGETADIVISGPSWLAKQVQSSDWFKDNYDNKTFRKLAEMYVNNPNGTMVDPSDDTKTITYQEAFNRYQHAFDENVEAYKSLAKLKDNINGMFGAQLTDSQAIVAGTNYDKTDFDKNGAIYIPKWLSDKRDMTKYGSWDSENRTLSAEDFFNDFYSVANWDANGVQEVKDEARRRLTEFAEYAAMGKDDEEIKNVINAEDYRDELSRTISFANIVNSNRAESDVAMDVSMAFVGVGAGIFDWLVNFGSGVNRTISDLIKWKVDQIHDFGMDVLGMSEDDAGAFAVAMSPASAAVYTGLSALGEMFYMAENGGGTLEEFVSDVTNDLDNLAKLDEDSNWDRMRKDFYEGWNKQLQAGTDLSESFERGKFVGQVIGKIIENIDLLNTVGGKIGGKVGKWLTVGTGEAATTAAVAAASGTSAVSTAVFTTEGLASGIKALATSGGGITAANVFVKTASLVANAGVQGVIETLADDSDAFHAFVKSGDTEVVGILMKNSAYNMMGEMMGWGTHKIGETIPGKAIKGTARRATNAVANVRLKTIRSLMRKVYGETPANAKVANKMKFISREIDITGQVAKGKITEGADIWGWSNAVYKNYDAQQALVNKRIVLENAYDAMNASIEQSMKGVEMDFDPIVVDSFYRDVMDTFETDAALIKSGQLTKSAVPGNRLSQEACDYLSYYQHYVPLKNAMNTPGRVLTDEEAARAAMYEEKLSALSSKLGSEYTAQLDGLYMSMAAYTQQLNVYRVNNMLFIDEAEENMQRGYMESGEFGENGAEYIRTERYIEGENYADLAKTADPTAPRGAKAGKKFGKEIDAPFVDPTTTMLMDLSRTASLKVQRDWQKALLDTDTLTGNVVATAEEKALSDNFSRLRRENRANFKVNKAADSPLSKNIREAVSKNDILARAYKRTQVANATVEKASKAVKQGNQSIKTVLDLKGTRIATMDTFKAEDIARINAGLTKNQIPDFNLNNMRAPEFNQWHEALPRSSRNLIKTRLGLANKKVNITNVRQYMREHPSLRVQLQVNHIANSPEIMKTDVFNQVLRERREGLLKAREKTILANNIAKVEKNEAIIAAHKAGGPDAVAGKYGEAYTKALADSTEDIIEGMREFVVGNKSSMKIIENMVNAGVEEEMAIRYVTLHNLKTITAGDIKKAIRASDFASNELIDVKKSVMAKSVKNYVENLSDAIYKNIQSEYNNCLRGMLDGKFGAVLDPNEAYARVEEYVGQIGAEVSASNVIAVPDVAKHSINYIKVDPLTADLYNLRPGSFTMTMGDYGTGAQHVIGFFNRLNRVFQWGTTGFSLTSFVNQWWRDSFNAVVVGGARPFLDFGIGLEAADSTLGRSFAGQFTKNYISEYGPRTAKMLQEEMGEEAWSVFVKGAEDAGMSIEEASVRYAVRTTGYEMLPGQEQLTTVGYYMGGETSPKFAGDMGKIRSQMYENASERMGSLYAPNGVKKAKGAVDKFVSWVSSKQLGQFRETTLRQNVYASAFGRAIDSGMCLSEAKAYATRFALDATTDFARPLMIGDSIAKSVPYFGAAINGVESFYRLMEIDPTGVAGRFIGGIILPAMAAIGETLADEESRKIYMNIPEYEKEDALVFVKNGVAMAIPLPQEISGYLAPVRHAVEAAYDANDDSWLSIISSDLLGISPVDLSGFVDLDASTLMGDPSFGERIARGVEKAGSQLMPSAAKAAYKAVFGRDPYTGKNIDRQYTYYDNDGNLQVMDSTQSEFAQWLSSTGFGNLSPSSANAIFKDLLGRAWMNLADAIVTTLTKSPGEGALKLAEKAGKGALGVMAPDVYNKGRNDWTSAVRQLEQEKATIQASKEYQSLQQKIAFETDPVKLKKLYAESDEYTYNYQKKVCEIVDNLKKKYPGMYNKSRQGAVLALLNMNTYSTGSQSTYARGLSKEMYYQGRQQAIATMQKLGFTSVEDNTILGHGVYKDGEYKFVYNSPLVIMDMGSILYGQSNLNKANIESILEVNNITRGNMYGDEWNKLQTKADKKAYKQEWNKRVITVLAPYITQHGVEAVLSDYETRDLLDNYIFVDNPYKTKDYLYQIFGGK